MNFTPPPTLSPTARLILATVRSATTPMSLDAIALATSSPSSTVLSVTQDLVRAGHLIRTKIRRFSYFTVPPVAVPVPAYDELANTKSAARVL